ncbi:MAG TPA: zinc/iron permease, partial [Synergistaceae bacterium]|nr:zinc/iron permease [Synergistaceae bacterium]HCP07265.1 zinc/iron permease [Synergistaceae bacterium]
MLQGSFAWIALFAFLAATVNALGILVVFRYREQAEKLTGYLMCFAAGVLISTPLMIALPAALERDPRSGFMALGGFLFMFFSNKVIRYYTHEEALAFGITAAQGIAVHSFVDGIVYTVTFEVSV